MENLYQVRNSIMSYSGVFIRELSRLNQQKPAPLVLFMATNGDVQPYFLVQGEYRRVCTLPAQYTFIPTNVAGITVNVQNCTGFICCGGSGEESLAGDPNKVVFVDGAGDYKQQAEFQYFSADQRLLLQKDPISVGNSELVLNSGGNIAGSTANPVIVIGSKIQSNIANPPPTPSVPDVPDPIDSVYIGHKINTQAGGSNSLITGSNFTTLSSNMSSVNAVSGRNNMQIIADTSIANVINPSDSYNLSVERSVVTGKIIQSPNATFMNSSVYGNLKSVARVDTSAVVGTEIGLGDDTSYTAIFGSHIENDRSQGVTILGTENNVAGAKDCNVIGHNIDVEFSPKVSNFLGNHIGPIRDTNSVDHTNIIGSNIDFTEKPLEFSNILAVAEDTNKVVLDGISQSNVILSGKGDVYASKSNLIGTELEIGGIVDESVVCAVTSYHNGDLSNCTVVGSDIRMEAPDPSSRITAMGVSISTTGNDNLVAIGNSVSVDGQNSIVVGMGSDTTSEEGSVIFGSDVRVEEDFNTAIGRSVRVRGGSSNLFVANDTIDVSSDRSVVVGTDIVAQGIQQSTVVGRNHRIPYPSSGSFMNSHLFGSNINLDDTHLASNKVILSAGNVRNDLMSGNGGVHCGGILTVAGTNNDTTTPVELVATRIHPTTIGFIPETVDSPSIPGDAISRMKNLNLERYDGYWQIPNPDMVNLQAPTIPNNMDVTIMDLRAQVAALTLIVKELADASP